MEGNNQIVESDSEREQGQATPVGELEMENMESSQNDVDSQEKKKNRTRLKRKM